LFIFCSRSTQSNKKVISVFEPRAIAHLLCISKVSVVLLLCHVWREATVAVDPQRGCEVHVHALLHSALRAKDMMSFPLLHLLYNVVEGKCKHLVH